MLLLALACSDARTRALPEVAAFEPAPAGLHRLTDVQYRNAVWDLTGVDFAGELPLDYRLHGYDNVGAGELTVSPLDLELYEAASWEIALAALPEPPCAESICTRGWVATVGAQAWRRPLTTDELDGLMDLHEGLLVQDVTSTVAHQALLAALLQSPHFVFRVAKGEPHPTRTDRRRLGPYELAARLAFFLTDAPPDAALLAAAEDGSILETDTLERHARRLLVTDRAVDTLTRFFAETVELDRLETVEKEDARFDDALKADMEEELIALFQLVVFEQDAPLVELMVTDQTWAGTSLVALYGLSEGGWTTMPPEQERGGLLGRAGLMAILSHNTLTSPTRRGKWVRTRLLCHSVPPPPEGVEADVEALPEDGTMRDKLAVHASDDACVGCHQLVDPVGFAFEHFDAIGAYRETDGGLELDTTGTLDGVAFDGAAELGQVVADHPDFPGCQALNLYRFGVGTAERDEELVLVDELGRALASDGRLTELAVDLVLSEGFREVSAPLGEACEDEGEGRACSTPCGDGTEVCADGVWRGCTAPSPGVEACDGLDQDCDGSVDEGVERVCVGEFGAGTEVCVDGGFEACVAPPAPPEVCDGVDQDADGLVDEGLDVWTAELSFTDLAAWHESCAPSDDGVSGACGAAVHRFCASSGCGVSGVGLIDVDAFESVATVECVSSAVAQVHGTTFTALAAQHGGCTSSTPVGPDCKAAVNRWCAANGLVTGYGPIEYSGDTAYVVCTPGAFTAAVTYSEMLAYDGTCDGSTERWGVHCNAAFDAYCLDVGADGGHGPLENSGDVAHVACLEVPE